MLSLGDCGSILLAASDEELSRQEDLSTQLAHQATGAGQDGGRQQDDKAKSCGKKNRCALFQATSSRVLNKIILDGECSSCC